VEAEDAEACGRGGLSRAEAAAKGAMSCAAGLPGVIPECFWSSEPAFCSSLVVVVVAAAEAVCNRAGRLMRVGGLLLRFALELAGALVVAAVVSLLVFSCWEGGRKGRCTPAPEGSEALVSELAGEASREVLSALFAACGCCGWPAALWRA
jgi:hypothetical protein